MTSRTLTVSSADRARREPWVRSRGLLTGPLAGRPDHGEHAVWQHRPRARWRRPNAHRSEPGPMDASPETSVQTLAGIGAGPVPAHDLAPVHQRSIRARAGELLATGETVRTRSVETRDELTVRRRRSRGSRATGGPTPRSAPAVHQRAHRRVAPAQRVLQAAHPYPPGTRDRTGQLRLPTTPGLTKAPRAARRRGAP